MSFCFVQGNAPLFRNFERPFTPQTWLGSARNLAKTRFRQFPTFHFSTAKIFFRRKFWIEKFVFHYFCKVLEQLEANGPQNQLPRQILLQIHLSWGVCDPKSWKKARVTTSTYNGALPWKLIRNGTSFHFCLTLKFWTRSFAVKQLFVEIFGIL